MNHSNDATVVKQWHLWGKRAGVPTSTVHDAFFANSAHMVKGRHALREIYAATLNSNSVKKTLDEMKARGLPKELYDKYLEEAIQLGIIPVAGVSKIGNRVITEDDILTLKDILVPIRNDFKTNRSFYGIG